MKEKSIAEIGKYKDEISTALYSSENVLDVIVGDTSNMTLAEKLSAFKEHVKSHLFIDDVVKDADMYVFYDITLPSLGATTKRCRVIMYVIGHRDIIDGYEKEGYRGNRIDIASQMIVDALQDKEVINNFGIGEMNLDSVSIYNATRFYGRVLEFEVPNFR